MFKKNKPAPQPEQSLTLRYLALIAMLIPLIAMLRVRSSLAIPVIIAASGICGGHWYSYHHLKHPNRPIRVILFVAIHLAMCWLFIGLFGGFAVPQAQFAVLAQGITSFDLRYRRSLFNTLIHSLAILYVVASLSRTTELAIYLLLFGILVLGMFFVAAKADGIQQAKLLSVAEKNRLKSSSFQFNTSPYRRLTLFGAGFGLIAGLMIFVVFLFIPRFANRPLVPPFTINAPIRGGVKAEIINPGLPVVQINGWSDEESEYFYGFDTNLDLRYRGGLSDKVVMYVRSPSRSYWRSHSYDFYNGVAWSQSDQTLTPVDPGRSIHYRLFVPLGSALNTNPADFNPREQDQIVQSFTIVHPQPNLVFAAYRPVELYLVTESVSTDQGDGIRLPESLEAGLTYTVVSYRPTFELDLLRQASTAYPSEITARYLQLPDSISMRVRDLAQTLTAPYDNPYDQIMALNDHLLSEYPYNFFPPPHPDGAEVVDTFLFEDKEGVCEQYATALVVMARTLDIPARLTTGYGAGEYSNLTGFYEVRASDAHSWVEIYFPDYGWVPFDPTPGWNPQPYPTPIQTWLFSTYGDSFANLSIPMAAAVAGIFGGLGSLFSILIQPLIVLLGLALVFFLGRYLKSLWAKRQTERYTPPPTHPLRRAILALYRQATTLLHRRNHRPREKWETLSEYAHSLDQDPLDTLTQITEVATYSPTPPTEQEVGLAQSALVGLREWLKEVS